MDDGDEITAPHRAGPQERSCPTCGGPVVTKSKAAADWADYAAWVDAGVPPEPTSTLADDLRRAFERLPDHFPEPKCGNCGRGVADHGLAPDFQCPPVATMSDLLGPGDGE